MEGELTRAEHLAWCKERALAFLPDDPKEAFASMGSDLNKHHETRNHGALELGMMQLMGGHLDDPRKMRNFIEGFK